MAAVQSFLRRIEIRLNRSEVTSYFTSIVKTPAFQPEEGNVTIKVEPRNENELLPITVKTEYLHCPEQEVHRSQVKGFNCPTCQLTFKYRLHLKHHQSTNQRCIVQYGPKGDVERKRHPAHTKNEVFPCPECKKVFSRSSNLKCHIASIHSNKRPYVCSACLHSFKLQHNLFEHTRKEHKFKCENCELSFVRKHSLEEHAIKYHQTVFRKCFPCPECKKELLDSSKLQRHIATVHSIERPYVCSTCQHSFKFVNDIKRHSRKEHKFKCENCELSFLRNTSLEEHVIKYHQTVSRKYVSCPECKNAFLNSGKLQCHFTLVHSMDRPYVCSTCLQSFKLVGDLNRHTKMEHKFKCENCELSFVSIPSLEKHLVTCEISSKHLLPAVTVTIKEEPR